MKANRFLNDLAGAPRSRLIIFCAGAAALVMLVVGVVSWCLSPFLPQPAPSAVKITVRAKFSADGTFVIHDVIAANYQMDIRFYSTHHARPPKPVHAKFTMPDIPGGVSDEPLNIPAIMVNP